MSWILLFCLWNGNHWSCAYSPPLRSIEQCRFVAEESRKSTMGRRPNYEMKHKCIGVRR